MAKVIQLLKDPHICHFNETEDFDVAENRVLIQDYDNTLCLCSAMTSDLEGDLTPEELLECDNREVKSFSLDTITECAKARLECFEEDTRTEYEFALEAIGDLQRANISGETINYLLDQVKQYYKK